MYIVCTILLFVVFGLIKNNQGNFITLIILGFLGGAGLFYLIYREGRFLNKFSYITFLFMALLCASTFSSYQKISPEKEGTFFFLTFFLVLGIGIQAILLLKKTGFIRQIAKAVVVLCILSSSFLMFAPPHFHQSFIYTRLFFLINIAYCIFLISRKSRGSIVLGTFGIFVALGCSLYGSYYFSKSKTFVSEKENALIVTEAVPKAKNIISSINTLNKTSFAKDFSKALADKNGAGVFDWAVTNVGYLTLNTDPSIYFKAGQYVVEYTTKSNKVTNNVILIVSFIQDGTTFKIDGLTILMASTQ
jgi:hypothetical protein